MCKKEIKKEDFRINYIRGERIRWKPTYLCKLCKFRSESLDLDPKARTELATIYKKDPAPHPRSHISNSHTRLRGVPQHRCSTEFTSATAESPSAVAAAGSN
jgi:hypothetical protein